MGTEQEIQQAVNEFTAKVTAIAFASVRTILESIGANGATTTPRAEPKAREAKPVTASNGASKGKRTRLKPDEIAKHVDALVALILDNPNGLSRGQVQTALKLSESEYGTVTAAARKAERIKLEGVKRTAVWKPGRKASEGVFAEPAPKTKTKAKGTTKRSRKAKA